MTVCIVCGGGPEYESAEFEMVDTGCHWVARGKKKDDGGRDFDADYHQRGELIVRIKKCLKRIGPSMKLCKDPHKVVWNITIYVKHFMEEVERVTVPRPDCKRCTHCIRRPVELNLTLQMS